MSSGPEFSLLAKRRRKVTQKGGKCPPAPSSVCWLNDAGRGPNRNVQKQSLGEDPKTAESGLLTPLGPELLLLAKRRRRGSPKGAKPPPGPEFSLLAKRRRKVAQKGGKCHPAPSSVYWLNDAGRDPNRSAQQQSLAENPKTAESRRLTPLGPELPLLAK